MTNTVKIWGGLTQLVIDPTRADCHLPPSAARDVPPSWPSAPTQPRRTCHPRRSAGSPCPALPRQEPGVVTRCYFGFATFTSLPAFSAKRRVLRGNR